METLKKLKWGKVAALTQDGQKYSDYISEMQVNNLFFHKIKNFHRRRKTRKRVQRKVVFAFWASLVTSDCYKAE
jgi:hypothetical protein